MGRTKQTQSRAEQQSIPINHTGAQKRWAIQIATVDSLKWGGHNKIPNLLGRHSVEHSYTRLAQIWCDENDKPLKDPATGNLYPSITIRAELNPGAVDPKTGYWSGLQIDPHTIKDVLSPLSP